MWYDLFNHHSVLVCVCVCVGRCGLDFKQYTGM